MNGECNPDRPSLAGWPHELREQLPGPDVRPDGQPRRCPSPSPSREQSAEAERQVWATVSRSLLTSRASRTVFGRRPVADELWRIGTDPYTGITHVNRFQLSLGCAAGLLAELMVDTRPDVTPDRPQRPVLGSYLASESGLPVLAPDLHAYRDAPPRDPLLYQVLAELVKDTADTRRPVAEYIEYLAESAYSRVAGRLVTDRLLAGSTRRMRPWGRRHRVWTAAVPTASLNAMNRLPRELAHGTALGEADRVLLGLLGVVDLYGPIRHEYGQRIAWPDTNQLLLPDRLRWLVEATRVAVAVTTRRPHH